jgi:protein TonB
MTTIEPNIRTLEGGQGVYSGTARRKILVPLSLGLHAVAAVALVVVPLISGDALPEVADQGVRAFFVQPESLQPPPPPPPPAGVRSAPRSVPQPILATAAFVAPVEVPSAIEDDSSESFGIEGGVVGGVEGGVPGGVIGGVVGGLPTSAPAVDLPKVVRVGGAVKEPRKVKHVEPVYPDLALRARVEGLVVLEARIAPNGSVGDVRVLRGVPMLDEAAVDAVRRWVYSPTLVDGVPATALMTVTVRFRLAESTVAGLL